VEASGWTNGVPSAGYLMNCAAVLLIM